MAGVLGRFVSVLAALALLGGCGGSGRQAAPPPPPAPPPPASPQPAPPAQPPASTGAAAADPKLLEAVVRAWSKALNAGDNEAAANLFAAGALVVQGDVVIQLATHRDAVLFNAGLPCSGEIVELAVEGDVVTAIFVLGDRVGSKCDAPPGTRAAAQLGIANGKIVVWKQIPVPDQLAPSPSPAPAPPAEEPA